MTTWQDIKPTLKFDPAERVTLKSWRNYLHLESATTFRQRYWQDKLVLVQPF